MKIQCDVCEKAAATLICCADEAALCAKCDVEIHEANRLASKHQRLLLQTFSTKLPLCDICRDIFEKVQMQDRCSRRRLEIHFGRSQHLILVGKYDSQPAPKKQKSPGCN